MSLVDAIEELVNARRPGRETLRCLNSTTPVALYGSGSMGRDVREVLTRAGVIVRCFLDAKRAGDTLDGIPVLHPDDAVFSEEDRAQTPVIISIFNAYVDMLALHEELRGFGWKSLTTFLEFYQPFAKELGDRYWLTDVERYRDSAGPLRAAANLLGDDASRNVFERTLRFRATGDYALLPKPEDDCQYFPTDLPQWETPLRFVDCGAFDGDTVRYLIEHKIPVDAIAAFEPDNANFAKLAGALTELSESGTATAAWPCAVTARTTQLRFESGRGAGSAIAEGGSQVVQGVSLDEALPSFKPNLIKMDIEGAEYDALLGARNAIQRYRPALAVCVYHRPEHIWLLPLLVNSYNLNYRLFLRSHLYNGFDLVLYAIPS